MVPTATDVPTGPALESLEVFLGTVQELVLYLRDEGHLLSAIDQHIIEGWWAAGYPLAVVEREVVERGKSLKARKNPPRGLPLRSLDRYVKKAGARSLRQGVGQHPAPLSHALGRSEAAQLALIGLETDLCDAQALVAGDSARARVLADALQGLSALQGSDVPDGRLFAQLLAMSRRYYDGCWAALDGAEQRRIEAEVLEPLGFALGSMSAESREETVRELCRRALRTQDPILDPDRYWWDGRG